MSVGPRFARGGKRERVARLAQRMVWLRQGTSGAALLGRIAPGVLRVLFAARKVGRVGGVAASPRLELTVAA
jgi:hypothetical protein